MGFPADETFYSNPTRTSPKEDTMTDIDPRKRPMEYQLDEIYRERQRYNLGPSKDEYRDLEVRALCRIADKLRNIEGKLH